MLLSHWLTDESEARVNDQWHIARQSFFEKQPILFLFQAHDRRSVQCRLPCIDIHSNGIDRGNFRRK